MPLMFNASSPLAPDDPGADTVLLVRQVHVDPDYRFSGQVQAPGFAEAMQHALGVTQAPAGQGTATPAQKKRGFWSKVKRIFGGSWGVKSGKEMRHRHTRNEVPNYMPS